MPSMRTFAYSHLNVAPRTDPNHTTQETVVSDSGNARKAIWPSFGFASKLGVDLVADYTCVDKATVLWPKES